MVISEIKLNLKYNILIKQKLILTNKIIFQIHKQIKKINLNYNIDRSPRNKN
jgi:hypothetical protein